MWFNTFLPKVFPELSQSMKNGRGTESENVSMKTSLCGLNKATTYSSAAILGKQNRTFQNRFLQT